MNADILVSRVRDWLSSWVSHCPICVHLRTRLLTFLIRQPEPDGTRHGPAETSMQLWGRSERMLARPDQAAAHPHHTHQGPSPAYPAALGPKPRFNVSPN